ncbi:MAG TPA: hypothetical protein VIH59_09530 [Candidatus Tectomicrobia bacterium]|jgi:hypothetical protein
MDATTAANVIRWYRSLEEQLQNVLNVVPPLEPNLRQAWSPMLATVIVEACNLVESILYDITPDHVQAPWRKGRKPWRSRNCLTLKDYACLYCQQLHLTECKVVFFHEPLSWQRPFEQWSGQQAPFPAPDWWAVHNKSKHRRLSHFAEFTLEKAIAALAGAMVVITSAPTVPVARELFWAMIQHEWINPANDFPASTIEEFYGGQGASDQYLCVETSLFAVLFGRPSLPEDINRLWTSGLRLFMGGEKLRTWTWHKQ